MLSIEWFWYQLTAYVPRRIPTDAAEWADFKRVMIHAYGVPDEPPSWITAFGVISSAPGNRIRIPYGDVANAMKRIYIHKTLAQFKQEAMRELNAKLEAAVKSEVERMKNDESQAPQLPPADDVAPSLPN